MKEKFVIIEHYLFEGWLAIEGDENDKLKEAEEELFAEFLENYSPHVL